MPATFRKCDQPLIDQHQTAFILAKLLMLKQEAEVESSELSDLAARQESRKDVLAFVGLFVSFSVLAWPLCL